MIRSWDFNCKDFGRCIDWLRLAAQSLFRISGHPEVFTAIVIIIMKISLLKYSKQIVIFKLKVEKRAIKTYLQFLSIKNRDYFQAQFFFFWKKKEKKDLIKLK